MERENSQGKDTVNKNMGHKKAWVRLGQARSVGSFRDRKGATGDRGEEGELRPDVEYPDARPHTFYAVTIEVNEQLLLFFFLRFKRSLYFLPDIVHGSYGLNMVRGYCQLRVISISVRISGK